MRKVDQDSKLNEIEIGPGTDVYLFKETCWISFLILVLSVAWAACTQSIRTHALLLYKTIISNNPAKKSIGTHTRVTLFNWAPVSNTALSSSKSLFEPNARASLVSFTEKQRCHARQRTAKGLPSLNSGYAQSRDSSFLLLTLLKQSKNDKDLSIIKDIGN